MVFRFGHGVAAEIEISQITGQSESAWLNRRQLVREQIDQREPIAAPKTLKSDYYMVVASSRAEVPIVSNVAQLIRQIFAVA